MITGTNTYGYVGSLDSSGNIIGYRNNFRKLEETAFDNKSFKDTLSISASVQNIGVADLSERNTDYYKTGDYVQDRKIEMGIQYKKSCFDFTNASDFDELTAAEDFTGMSNAEKYKAIYEKYQHCYGDNFLDAFAISYVSQPHPSEDRFREVMQNFFNEVNTVCGGEAEAIEARQEALYGGGSDYEIRQSIIDKYPCAGEMTFRDLYKMTFEMKLAGVGGDVNNWIGELFGSFGYYSNGLVDTEFLREEKLDSAVTLNHLQYLENNYSKRISNGIAIHPEFGAALSQVMEAFDNKSFKDTLSISASVQNIGVADPSKRTEPEYTTCITALDGNPNHPNIEKMNKQINIGMEYKKSRFDFTFSKDFAQMKADEETVGYENMTAAEKYETVYNRYTHCYGENFLDAFMLSYPSPAQEDPYRQIVDNFYSEIEQLCGSREAGMQARREMLYGDMSDYDVRNSIIEEHYFDGEMTFRDFYSMTYDMELCGVGGDVHYWISEIFDGYGYYLNDGSGFYQERRDEMLDSTVTSEHLNFMQNNYYGRIYSGGLVNPEFGAVLSQVTAKFLGGVL